MLGEGASSFLVGLGGLQGLANGLCLLLPQIARTMTSLLASVFLAHLRKPKQKKKKQKSEKSFFFFFFSSSPGAKFPG